MLPSSVDFSDLNFPTCKTLYIEMYFDDTLLSSGSGFLIARTRESHCTFITNRHNVTGKNQDTGAHLSRTLAEPNFIKIFFHKNQTEQLVGEWLPILLPLYKDDVPQWVEHPKYGTKADVVALNLRWGDDVCKLPYYLDLDLDQCPLDIRPSETVSVVGFPFGLSSFGKFPIWATGFLAQELSLVTEENPVFLIDCRSRQGQSGAAVVAFRAGSYRVINKKAGKISQVIDPTQTVWKFLGIYSGRVNAESDLGRVWHFSILGDLCDAAASRYEEQIKAVGPNTQD